MSGTKTFAFFGASGGCGLSALNEALDAGHTCIALLRSPAKLADLAAKKPNLIIREGNAHDAAAVATALTVPGQEHRLVDAISFSIGSTMDPKTFKFIDPDVCKKGMAALLEALTTLRRDHNATGSPLISIVSTTGISDVKRDVPLAFWPMYHFLLATPHADKKVMEQQVRASCERWVLIRPSFLVDSDKRPGLQGIREGFEDVATGTLEKKEMGYAISRGAVGRWIYGRLLAPGEEGVRALEGKAVSITW